MASQRAKEHQELQAENERLRGELALSQERMRGAELGAEEHLKSRLEREKDLLLLDQDQDRGAYQRLLAEYHELEQRAEMLEQKLAVALGPVGGGGRHSRSLSNASSSGSAGPIVATELAQDDQNIVSFGDYLFLSNVFKWVHWHIWEESCFQVLLFHESSSISFFSSENNSAPSLEIKKITVLISSELCK